MAIFREILFRAAKKPTVPLPFGARSVGHYCIDIPHREDSKRKDFVQVFWGIAGQGYFVLDTKEVLLDPGQVFIYFPGDRHILGAVSPEWEYRWFTLDGEMNTDIVSSFGLKRGLRKRAGACPDELFIQLTASLRDITPNGERRAAAVAFSILTHICGMSPVIKREESAVFELKEQIEKHFTEPGFSVIETSKKLGQNRSSLSRRFKTEMGMAPQDYLTLLKMQKAMGLLRETDLHVCEVADQVGYTDPNYFGRIFRQQTGMKPTEFRAQ